MNISGGLKPMHQWQPQHPIQGKDLEISSYVECPSSKKRRISENSVPNQWVPGGCFKPTQCGSQFQGFANDSRKLCRLFWNGTTCSYGDRCRFLHEIPDKIRDISMVGFKPSVASVNQNKGSSSEMDCKGYIGSLSVGDEGNSKSTLWKTKVCKNWKMTGGCPYGKVCLFAHGLAELQNHGGHFALDSWMVPTCAWKNVHNDRNWSGNSFKQQVQESKGLLKRKPVVKLCDIYADWLEDMTILPTLSFK